MRRNLKPRKPKGAPLAPMELLEADTIERILKGLRSYIIAFIGPSSHFALAWASTTKEARQSRRALELSPLPQKAQSSALG